MSDEEDNKMDKTEKSEGSISPWKGKRLVDSLRSPKKETADVGYGLPDMPNETLRKYQRGVEFRGKLIGSDTVPSPKGDSMCHTALAKLKAAILVAKQHKPRLLMKITDKELRLLDQDTRTDLHIHKLYKISYIVSDPNDRRAFGYIYGEKEGPWTFYGIKTEGPAIATIVAIKELFEALASRKQSNEDDATKTTEKEEKKSGEEKSASTDKPSATEKTDSAEKPKEDAKEAPAVTVSPVAAAAPVEEPPKRQSIEDLLALGDDFAGSGPSLTPRSSIDVTKQAEAAAAQAAEKPQSVQDVLSDLFSPMSFNASSPPNNPFGQPQQAMAFMPQQQPQPAFFQPAGPQYGNVQFGANFGAAFPPQQQAFYGQPMAPYANAPGYGFGMQTPFGANRFPTPMPQQQPFGFGQTFETASTGTSLDVTSALTPQVAPNAPTAALPLRQAPRPPAPASSDSGWSFAGTGLPPRQDSGLFSEFLSGELESATQQAKTTTGNYVPMGELVNNGGNQTGNP